MKLETKLPLWLATPMRPAGGYGATIWAHRLDRRADDALAVGPGEQDAELVGEGHQLGLGPPAVLPRLAVAARRDERRPDALRRAGPQQRRRWPMPACTRRRGRSRRRAGRRRRRRCGCRAPPRPAGWCRRRRPGSRWRAGCAATTNPNLPGCDEAPATSTPRGSNRARNCSAVGGRAERSGVGPSAASRELDERVDGDRRALRRDDQRVDVDALDVGPLDGDLPEADEDLGEGDAVDGCLAAERLRAGAGWPAGRSSRGP